MTRLTVDQVLIMHQRLVEEFGGKGGVRDEGALESAVNAPFQTFGGSDIYPGVVKKAARLAYGLIMDHPFIDGNKRIGAHSLMVFLDINGIELAYEDDDFTSLILDVASNKKKAEDIEDWIRAHLA